MRRQHPEGPPDVGVPMPAEAVGGAAARIGAEGMEAAFELLPDAVFCVCRPALTLTYANAAACARLGHSREELLGADLNAICPSGDVAALVRQFDRPAGETAVLRALERRRDGTTLPAEWHVSQVSVAGRQHWIVVARDLSAAAAEDGSGGPAAQELGRLGHDPLTGLPDRRLFERRVDRALERARHHEDYVFAVCFLDLDGFKGVNDRLGHLAGDRVLCEVARRLVGCTRPGDMAARYGGDEFMVFVDDLHGTEDAMLVAGRILRQMETPVPVGGLFRPGFGQRRHCHELGRLSAGAGVVGQRRPRDVSRQGPGWRPRGDLRGPAVAAAGQTAVRARRIGHTTLRVTRKTRLPDQVEGDPAEDQPRPDRGRQRSALHERRPGTPDKSPGTPRA